MANPDRFLFQEGPPVAYKDRYDQYGRLLNKAVGLSDIAAGPSPSFTAVPKGKYGTRKLHPEHQKLALPASAKTPFPAMQKPKSDKPSIRSRLRTTVKEAKPETPKVKPKKQGPGSAFSSYYRMGSAAAGVTDPVGAATGVVGGVGSDVVQATRRLRANIQAKKQAKQLIEEKKQGELFKQTVAGQARQHSVNQAEQAHQNKLEAATHAHKIKTAQADQAHGHAKKLEEVKQKNKEDLAGRQAKTTEAQRLKDYSRKLKARDYKLKSGGKAAVAKPKPKVKTTARLGAKLFDRPKLTKKTRGLRGRKPAIERPGFTKAIFTLQSK